MIKIRNILVSFSILFVSSAANAIPLQSLAGLSSITIYETTTHIFNHTFGVTSSQMLTRLGNPLSAINNDFSNHSLEWYDAFYSNADGTHNTQGAYITIEAQFPSPGPGGGGLNVNEVVLNFSGGGTENANVVTSFNSFGFGAFPSTVGAVADGNVNTFTTLGSTSTASERLSVTVGFASTAEVSEPGPFVILTLGLVQTLMVRRQRVL